MSKKHYKYKLRKGSKKNICPSCGEKKFVPYVHSADGVTLAGEMFGRCERINSCGYIRYPDNNQDYEPPKEIPTPPKPIQYFDKNLMLQTQKHFEHQTLFRYFCTIFEKSDVFATWKNYFVGTSKTGSSIFWQVDFNGNVRSGKIMQYLETGKRDKSNFGTWAHAITHLKQGKEFELSQVFFGEHLLNVPGHKKVGIVESEKTALAMSILFPKIIWLASGGLTGMQMVKFLHLKKNCEVVLFPDKGCEAVWQEKTNNKYRTDMTLVTSNIESGADLFDLWLKDKTALSKIINNYNF